MRFHKANIKNINLRKVLSRAKKQHKNIFLLLTVLTTVLFVFFLIIIFGIDQILINTQLNGRVISEDGKPVEGAQILVQGIETLSDNNGYFFYKDLDFGNFEIVVNKNGFSRHNQRIKLNRFSNYIELPMQMQEYGELKIRFNSERVRDKTINVSINNQVFPSKNTGNGFEVLTDRLLIGTYQIEVQSEDFIDFKEKIIVKPGNSEIEYKLAPASDVVTEFRDFVTNELVTPEKVTLSLEGNIVDLSTLEINNKVEIKDLEVAGDYELVINKAGYLESRLKINPQQGVNSLGSTYLYSNESFIYIDNKRIENSYIDGSKASVLYNSDKKCEVVKTKGSFTIISCSSNLLLYERIGDGFRLVREYVVNGNIFDLNINNLKIVTTNADLSQIEQIHSSVNSQVVYTHEKPIISIQVDYNGRIYFSDENAVFRLSDDFNSIEKIVDGKYNLEDISPNNLVLIALSNKASTHSNIWKIEIDSKNAQKITFLPGEFHNVQFQNNEQILFLDSQGLYSTSVSANNKTLLKNNVHRYWNDSNNSFLIAESGEGLLLISKVNNYSQVYNFATE